MSRQCPTEVANTLFSTIVALGWKLHSRGRAQACLPEYSRYRTCSDSEVLLKTSQTNSRPLRSSCLYGQPSAKSSDWTSNWRWLNIFHQWVNP